MLNKSQGRKLSSCYNLSLSSQQLLLHFLSWRLHLQGIWCLLAKHLWEISLSCFDPGEMLGFYIQWQWVMQCNPAWGCLNLCPWTNSSCLFKADLKANVFLMKTYCRHQNTKYFFNTWRANLRKSSEHFSRYCIPCNAIVPHVLGEQKSVTPKQRGLAWNVPTVMCCGNQTL